MRDGELLTMQLPTRIVIHVSGAVRPWESISDSDQAEIDRLKRIAFPNGITSLPHI